MWLQTINATKITEQGSKRHTDQLVMEKLTYVQINGQDYGSYYHAAQFEKEWGVGYGVLQANLDLGSINAKYDQGVIYLDSVVKDDDVWFKRDAFIKPVSASVFQLTAYFQQAALLYKKTAVTESVALAEGNQLLYNCEDISIENALFKTVGSYVLKEHKFPTDLILLVSSKIDILIMRHIVTLQVGIVISRTAPTKQALDLAQEHFITILGFARGRKYILYT